jgi:hypothetical protein
LSDRTPRSRRVGDEERELGGTPYVSRTPFGGAGLETPVDDARRGREDGSRVEGQESIAKKRRIDTDKGLDVGALTHHRHTILCAPD